MTKTCKKTLLVTLFTLFFVVCACFFAACGGTQNSAVSYTVTVKAGETAASGVKVTVGKGGASFGFKNTDANGKAVFELVPDDYAITLSDLPDGYILSDDADLNFTKDKHDLTVTLVEGFAYKVKLVNPDGTPYYAEGVTVGVCTLAGGCLTPVPLGADGIARCPAEPGDYHVQIKNLPGTACFEKDEKGYYTGEDFSATKTEMTITLYPVTQVTEATPMTDAQKTAYAEKNNAYTADNALTAYHFEKTLAAGETAYYSLTPAYDGDYTIYKDYDASYLLNRETFQKGNNGIQGLYYSISELKAGTTYYFNVSNIGEEAITAEFVIEVPAASDTAIIGASLVNVTIAKEGANAVIELKPAAGAAYKLTAQGATAVSIAQCDSAYYAQNAVHEDGSFGAGKEISAKYTAGMSGVYFSVAAKADSYPATFQIRVEKLRDLTDTTTKASVSATLTTAEKPEGKALKKITAESESDLVLGADGFYHLKTADGDLVYLDVASLAYIDMENSYIKYVLDVTSAADKADLTKGDSYKDYREFLRGFEDYDYEDGKNGPVPVIPTDITTEKYYTKSMNADGAYPLNAELLEFLKAFYENNKNNLLETGWLEWLYIYGEEVTSSDPVVGAYESAGGYALTVNADGTYTVTQEGRGGITEVEAGTWEKTGENAYNFIWTDNATYSITRNAETGALTWIDTEMGNSEPYGVFEVVTADPVVGNYSGGKMGPDLTVNADGTYVLTENGHNTPGTWVNNGDGTYTFTDDDTEWGYVYTAQFNEDTGYLEFYEDADPSMPSKEFERVEAE